MWSTMLPEGSATDAFPHVPDVIMIFGPTDTVIRSALAEDLAARYPDAILTGCSSGTMVDRHRLDDDATVVLGMGFERTTTRLSVQPLTALADSHRAGMALGADLADETLAGIFVLSNGLDVNGSALVDGIRQAVGAHVMLSGGLAGDGARFSDTRVLTKDGWRPDSVAAIGFYGDAIRFAYGSAGGWQPFGPVREISRADGCVLHTLDDQPALELYDRYLGDEATALPASGLIYPLKIWDPAHPEDRMVRTLLGIDRDCGSLTFAGDMPQGWRARLMRGVFDDLVDGADVAVRHAVDHAAGWGVDPALCLMVSCVGRRLLMGQRTEDELDVVAASLSPQTTLAGFYSYGEIAPQNASAIPCLHNQTMTITLMGEAA